MGGPAPPLPSIPSLPSPAAPAPTPPPHLPQPSAKDTPRAGTLALPLDPPAAAPTRLARFGWYALAAVAATALVAAGMRLDRADLRAPFAYDEDALLILPMVKATLERGSHWRNERMGAPGILELHDFPVVDHLHFAILWVMGRFTADVFLVYNLYYLLTYPLTAVVALAVLRHFGLSFPAAFAGATLYAFLPYHYMRGEYHYFLAAYWVVPVSLTAALWLCRGRLPFFEKDDRGRYRPRVWTRRSLAAVAIAAATASAGAYYAYFACALLLAGGLYGWAATRTWKAAASAGLLIGLVVAGGVANHLPTVFYQAKYGRNSGPHERVSDEAEYFGLKLTHLLLPVNDHNLPFLARIKSSYNSDSRPLQNENERATLGLVGAAGFLGLMAVLVLPVRKEWPVGPLAALAGFAVLIGTIGGLGAVFNHLLFPQVRCYNRISVFLAFLSLFAACHAADRFFLSRKEPARRLRIPAFAGLIALGVWDQTPVTWFRHGAVRETEKAADRFRTDREFFAGIEDVLPEGAVFQLPFVAYPESPWTKKLAAYEHARGYLHTDNLRWSFGAMKGREVDAWQREVHALVAEHAGPAETMLQRLVYRGFDGLLIDLRGYTPTRGRELLTAVNAKLGQHSNRTVVHADGQQWFFDLRPYRDWLRGMYGAVFDESCRREREAVSLIWLHGFVSYETPGFEKRTRWGTRKATALFINPTDRPRTFRVELTFRSDAPGDFGMTLAGGELLADEFAFDTQSGPRAYTVTVPPGRHPVTFRCRPPHNYFPTDYRDLCFVVKNFAMTEVP